MDLQYFIDFLSSWKRGTPKNHAPMNFNDSKIVSEEKRR